MKAFFKAIDQALLFFGLTSQKLSSRAGKKESGPVSLLQKHWSEDQPSRGGEGPSAGGEQKLEAELGKYSLLAEQLDTRVLTDRGWLRCLRGLDVWQSIARPGKDDLSFASQLTDALSLRFFELLSHLALEYNDLARAAISITPPSPVSERIKVVRVPGAAEVTETVSYTRWRISTSSWSLSCRSRCGCLELFLIPAQDIMALSRAEAAFRQKIKLELYKVADKLVWTSEALPISAEDLRVLGRRFFRDLVSATQDQEQPVQSVQSEIGGFQDARLARSIEQLRIERENLAQKVVIQQEEIQKRIARDLHDAVISDVMSLKRSITSDSELGSESLLLSLEGIVRKLREICYDLSPRDLSDWGLSTVVEDMLDQMSQRSGIDCRLDCESDLPTMPSAVLLHVYRIIQESLNNAEKYSEATEVVVSIAIENGKFVVCILDNGKGFDLDDMEKKSRSGGYGMGSLKERSDLIRCFYPTKLYISSMPQKGSTVRLEISV